MPPLVRKVVSYLGKKYQDYQVNSYLNNNPSLSELIVKKSKKSNSTGVVTT